MVLYLEIEQKIKIKLFCWNQSLRKGKPSSHRLCDTKETQVNLIESVAFLIEDILKGNGITNPTKMRGKCMLKG
ncbi:hypothetical protein AY606_12275 [Acinetobacter sp. SFB]|nr:hypothetical protein AY606_12275 [Acinetobacter sp. SFB]